jgi:hypothetical protein
MKPLLRLLLRAAIALLAASCGLHTQTPAQLAPSPPGVPLAQFVRTVREKAKTLENSSGMHSAFNSFLAAHHLSPESVRYSDFVIIRLLYEAARDAGFWNMHWSITNQPPNSDRIWNQWKAVRRPSPSEPTAIAECDELSALYAFLVERSGVKSVGLLWPTSNHTVAVWVLQPSTGPVIRVVVPTSQIFWKRPTRSTQRNLIPGARRLFTSTRGATFRTRLRFPGRSPTSFLNRLIFTAALRTQRCSACGMSATQFS